jgi:hypothetical protein
MPEVVSLACVVNSKKIQNMWFPVNNAESAKGGCEISIIVKDRD